jgi:hypothetical protein
VVKAVAKCVKFMKQDKWLVWSQHKKNTNGSVGQSKPLSDDVIYSVEAAHEKTAYISPTTFLSR